MLSLGARLSLTQYSTTGESVIAAGPISPGVSTRVRSLELVLVEVPLDFACSNQDSGTDPVGGKLSAGDHPSNRLLTHPKRRGAL